MVPTHAVENLDTVQLEVDGGDDATLPRYQSRGVTAGTSAVTVHVPVGESMLTLLLQLFRRFSRAKVYRLSLLVGAQSTVADSRVGDAEFFVCKVLDRACAESRECADIVNTLCQSTATGDDVMQPNNAPQEDKDERQALASV